jgi:hypothetical protein
MSLLYDNKLYNEPVKLLDLVTVLEEKEQDYRDEIVSADQLQMTSDGTLSVQTSGTFKEFEIQSQALQLICGKTKVPHSYVDRCEPWLKAININSGLEKLGNKEFLLRYDKDEVRAILTTQYMPISTTEVMKKVAEYTSSKGFKNPEIKFEWSPTKFVGQLILERDFTDKSVGTPVGTGLSIQMSDTGFAALSLSAYIMILQCTNGMIVQSVQDQFRQVHRGNDSYDFSDFNKSLEITCRKIPSQLEAFNRTRSIPAPDPIVIIQNIGKRFNLSNDVIKRIEEGWKFENRGQSLFAVINAFTYAGSNVHALPLNDRENLQSLASRLLQYTPKQMERLSIPFESAA